MERSGIQESHARRKGIPAFAGMYCGVFHVIIKTKKGRTFLMKHSEIQESLASLYYIPDGV